MDALYIKIKQILKNNRVMFSSTIAEDLIQECICCFLEHQSKSMDEQDKLIVSCARHFIYEYSKHNKLADVDNISIDDQLYILNNTNTQTITKIHGGKITSAVVAPQELTIRQLVESKGDYKIVEIARLIDMNRYSLYKAIKVNQLGIKSFMRLKLLQYFNKKEVTHNILAIVHNNSINKTILPITSRSYYNALHYGFSYTQAQKITIWLKNNYNIKGILDDIY